ncbi:hypothetical protein [Paenarthrobacter sp. UW852]|uniref:hypothetical protein n=1 Tax=Paenarthrobacter sp. UW852 TaxID=2951989 RepID=UPI0027E2A468|nr:hypothetical protein [Paenarthrobacter sp. UW852]
MADVLIHALRCRPELESLVMVQSAVSQALLSPDYLRSKLAGPRNGRARAVVGLVLPRADSLLEVLAHVHFTRAGLRAKMHVQLPGVGEVDCLINDCLVIELDGGTHVRHPGKMVAEVLIVLGNREAGHFGPSRWTPKWVPAS